MRITTVAQPSGCRIETRLDAWSSESANAERRASRRVSDLLRSPGISESLWKLHKPLWDAQPWPTSSAEFLGIRMSESSLDAADTSVRATLGVA
jgi:hypothetical protein